MNAIQMIDRIKIALMNYDDTANPRWFRPEILVILNEAQIFIQNEMVVLYDDLFATSAFLSRVAAQELYALPADFLSLRQLWDNTGNAPKIFERINYNERAKYMVGFDYASSHFTPNYKYYILGSQVGLLPKPTVSGTNDITIEYISQVTPMTEIASSVSGIPTEYHELVWTYALVACLEKPGSRVPGDVINMFRDRFAALLKRALKTLDSRRDQGPRFGTYNTKGGD